jgi:NAD(P)-dependent dehydrogenase (short-subunit alcohol dehydrogenase family)
VQRLSADGYGLAVLSSSPHNTALASDVCVFGLTETTCSAESLRHVADEAVERWGRLDVLINVSGVGPIGSLLNANDEDWHAGLEMSLVNIARAARVVVPLMVACGGGAIVNVSVNQPGDPHGERAVSSVLSAGLAAYTRSFAIEYAAHNVRMNNVFRVPSKTSK